MIINEINDDSGGKAKEIESTTIVMDGAEVDLGNDTPRPKKFYKTFRIPQNSMSGFSTFGFSNDAQ